MERLCKYNPHQFGGVICAPVPGDDPGGPATLCVSRTLHGPWPLSSLGGPTDDLKEKMTDKHVVTVVL